MKYWADSYGELSLLPYVQGRVRDPRPTYKRYTMLGM